MSLLFNILSKLVIAFLPRSKRLFVSWLQSPSAPWLQSHPCACKLFPLGPDPGRSAPAAAAASSWVSGRLLVLLPAPVPTALPPLLLPLPSLRPWEASYHAVLPGLPGCDSIIRLRPPPRPPPAEAPVLSAVDEPDSAPGSARMPSSGVDLGLTTGAGPLWGTWSQLQRL